MNKSVLEGKHILTVDNESDVLAVLREEIMSACSQCTIDEATTYDEALKFLQSKDYGIAIPDIMGVVEKPTLEVAQ